MHASICPLEPPAHTISVTQDTANKQQAGSGPYDVSSGNLWARCRLAWLYLQGHALPNDEINLVHEHAVPCGEHAARKRKSMSHQPNSNLWSHNAKWGQQRWPLSRLCSQPAATSWQTASTREPKRMWGCRAPSIAPWSPAVDTCDAHTYIEYKHKRVACAYVHVCVKCIHTCVCVGVICACIPIQMEGRQVIGAQEEDITNREQTRL